MVRKSHHRGSGVYLSPIVPGWFFRLVKESWPKLAPWATEKSWQSPAFKRLMVMGAIAEGLLSDDDPRIKKMLEKQMKGKRKKMK